jgi:hypothetical protein
MLVDIDSPSDSRTGRWWWRGLLTSLATLPLASAASLATLRRNNW